ncbi:9678_t:CDS:1 [Gigaspora margarita]|uniref:9678_t:CDS:1 n=1 Tax=Gigaspora margarita TaxID=4874 RepID=A0ABM8W6U4_GIGMA|nr:9678_t:CDS:1 [Gigaspora margarita]
MLFNSTSSQNSFSDEIAEKLSNATNATKVSPSNISNVSEISDMPTQLIKPPFPPMIKVSDIISKRDPTQINLKGPNAFLIYRKAFLDHLSGLMNLTSINDVSSSSLIDNESKQKGYGLKSHLKMTEFSKFVSICWNSEPEFVKATYKDMAKQVKDELEELRKNNSSSRIGRSKVIWRNAKCPIKKKKKDDDSNNRIFKNLNQSKKDNINNDITKNSTGNKKDHNKEKGNLTIKKDKSRSKNGSIGQSSKSRESTNNFVYEFIPISPETIKASQPKEKPKVTTSENNPWTTDSNSTFTINSNITFTTPTSELINNDCNLAYSVVHSSDHSDNLNYITNDQTDWNLNFLTAQYPVDLFYDNCCMIQSFSQGLPNERIGTEMQDLYLQNYL